MKREFLKNLGLTDELIEKVMTEHAKDIQDTNSKLATAEQERDSLKSQVTDCDNQIKDLGEKVGNSDGLQETIKNLKSTIEENDQKVASNLLQVKQDNAVQSYLKDAGLKALIGKRWIL
ncbi:phage scaffolding protein [Companilactobacillus baiquanensis]|uniref:Phage scaffolding protein n=1 Tax=Companilactobacillus baiquanensis TaxID=2486005 RepID=A0ABW1UUZ4_9LACO|nr:phage scaffolding protein [Companilactobacillus baiquanensis]